MPVPPPEATEPSVWMQLAGALVAIGSLAGMIYNGIKPKKEEKEPAQHVILDAASMADTRPFAVQIGEVIKVGERNAVANELTRVQVERSVAILDKIFDGIQQWVEEERALRRERERDERHENQMKEFVAEALKRADADRDRRRREGEG